MSFRVIHPSAGILAVLLTACMADERPSSADTTGNPFLSPSELPLGDKRRAPIGFADTGLLQRWGLRLDAPEQRGPRQSTIGGAAVLTASPGILERAGQGCRLADAGLVARCGIGQGEAIVIADADFLNLETGGVDGPTDGNLPALISQLTALSR